MKKAPEAFRTISEVADLLDTPAHVLRFWESKFYQIRPVKRAGGRRYYRPDDVALINGIRTLLQDRGMTIRGAQRILQEQGVKAVSQLGLPLPDGGAMLRLVRSADTTAETLHNDPQLAEEDAEIAFSAPDDDVDETAGVEQALDELPPRLPPESHKTVETEPVPEYALIQAMVEQPPAPGEAAPEATQAKVEGDAMSDEDLLSPLAEALPEAAPSLLERTLARAPLLPEALQPELPLSPEPAYSRTAQIARALRMMPRHAPGLQRDRMVLIARRIDTLLERMSEASGAGRW